jgi:hypothetical protein
MDRSALVRRFWAVDVTEVTESQRRRHALSRSPRLNPRRHR